MTFADGRWLWALAALVPMFLLEWRGVVRAERGLRRLVGEREKHPLLEQRRPGQRRIGIVLRLGALAFLALGAAGPEWGHELVRRTASGSDVVLVVDVSASMDARDVPPSRIAEARREALAVLERLGGSRVGVVAFAGDAVRLCPLTQDLIAVRLTLESLSSGSVSDPGTDLGRALRAAARLMPPGRREEQAILIWTDGEDLEQGGRGAIDEIAAGGVRVYAIGVGTPAGDVVPVLDDQGRATDIRRDENGSAVRSRLDEGLLRTLAHRTRGAYFGAARPGGELPRLLGALGGLARAGRGERLVERPVARFPVCAALAALLLALEIARPRRRVRTLEDAGPALHSERATAAVAVLVGVLLLASPRPAAAQSAWARGDGAFRAGRFAAAESLYAIRARHGARPEVGVNHATARALKGEREAGEEELSRFSGGEGRVGREARYNLGTSLAERNQLDEGLAALRRALERAPDDEDARWNYEVLERRKREQQQQQKSSSRQQKPQPQPQPSNPSPQSAGNQPNPGANQTPNPAPQTGPSQSGPPPPSGAGGMTKAQAEQLLGALQELARADQQRQHRVRVMREKRGKDW
jgi:Ca-activated chloride channel family protein